MWQLWIYFFIFSFLQIGHINTKIYGNLFTRYEEGERVSPLTGMVSALIRQNFIFYLSFSPSILYVISLLCIFFCSSPYIVYNLRFFFQHLLFITFRCVFRSQLFLSIDLPVLISQTPNNRLTTLVCLLLNFHF